MLPSRNGRAVNMVAPYQLRELTVLLQSATNASEKGQYGLAMLMLSKARLQFQSVDSSTPPIEPSLPPTGKKCKECNGEIVKDQKRGEVCCSKCGLIMDDPVFDRIEDTLPSMRPTAEANSSYLSKPRKKTRRRRKPIKDIDLTRGRLTVACRRCGGITVRHGWYRQEGIRVAPLMRCKNCGYKQRIHQPRSREALKRRAATLRLQGLTYRAISSEMARSGAKFSPTSIYNWLNPQMDLKKSKICPASPTPLLIEEESDANLC